MKKPQNNALTIKTTTNVLLNFQRYNLVVTYKKGTTTVPDDTLSCAHLSCVNVCEFSSNLELVDHTALLAVSEDCLQQIRHASATDSVLTVLQHTIQHGWPNDKKKVPNNIKAYYNDYRDELIVQDQLAFKGKKLVIPAAMRREMMSIAHSSHIGIEGCIH